MTDLREFCENLASDMVEYKLSYDATVDFLEEAMGDAVRIGLLQGNEIARREMRMRIQASHAMGRFPSSKYRAITDRTDVIVYKELCQMIDLAYDAGQWAGWLNRLGSIITQRDAARRELKKLRSRLDD